MRSKLLALGSAATLALCALLGVRGADETVKVKLRLIDAETTRGMAGIVRIFPKEGDKPLPLPGLFDRLRGLERSATVAGWYVVPAEGVAVALPKSTLRLEAVAGLETGLVRQEIDLTKLKGDEVAVKLPFVFRPEKHGLVAGNTHLHLRKLSREDADEYLRRVPGADGLKVLFISYLERNKDDVDYITNQYPIGALKSFDASVQYANGEEHRHNFEGFGQGYGHVMLLNIKELVKPVSLGPGITGAGFDDQPLAPGMDDARKQGGTLIWCHNTYGFEAVPQALAGKLDALNVYDGSRTGNYEERYYKFLNIGLRLPITTGTDWFMYDFSRVYAKAAMPLSTESWLAAIKAGRCQATNGPLLSLTVDGKEMGDVIALDKPATVKIEASGVGRHDFTRLELVRNGKVVKTQRTEAREGAFRAQLQHEERIDEPSWYAVRIESTNRNEFDLKHFAHSGPVYIDLGGKRAFDVESARALQKELEMAKAGIKAKGKFSNDEARDKLLARYDDAAAELIRQINQRGK